MTDGFKHNDGDLKHPDVEHGIVSRTDTKFVFVKFDKALIRLGWNGAASQACDPSSLVRERS